MRMKNFNLTPRVKKALEQAQELAKKRKISIEDELWNPKKKDKLIEELKLSH